MRYICNRKNICKRTAMPGCGQNEVNAGEKEGNRCYFFDTYRNLYRKHKIITSSTSSKS